MVLSRYILKEHLGPFVFGFVLIVFILIMDVVLQFLDQVLGKGLALGPAAQLFLFNLAWIIALAVPMAVLVAVLMAFGRLAADSEVLAVQACGISFIRALLPVLVAAGVLTVLMILFNDRVLPDWNHQARNISANLQRRKAALVLKEKEGVFIHDLGTYSLLIREVDGETNRLGGITLYDSRGSGPPATLHAPSGQVEILGDGTYIRLTLFDGEFHRIEDREAPRFSRGSFQRQDIHIADPQRAFEEYRSAYRSDREMGIAAMYGKVEEHRADLERTNFLVDSTAQVLAFWVEEKPRPFIEGESDPPPILYGGGSGPGAGEQTDSLRARQQRSLEEQLKRHRQLRDNRVKRIDEFLVEIHKKFSIPFACLVFVLVGAPVGALIRRRGAAVSVGVSLLFFLVYWMFLIGGEELADRDFIAPALAMWAPNIAFGALGLILISKAGGRQKGGRDR
ncbi:MAG: LptF/LptG family permease [Candidatus Latescibacteria bacterium]|nr:LptF/LptG family permease [Candidatus Latescibacterota bacterium]